MKLSVKAEHLKYLILGAGGVGLVLRIVLYATGIDGRGLLTEGHWASIALWALTFVAAVTLILFTRKLEGPASYADAHPVSFSAALGAFVAMVGLGITTLSEFSEFSSGIRLAVWLLGLCSTLAMGCIGICRITGRKPHFLLHAVVCIYFALRMVSQYRLWSADPQLQDYCFLLSAHVALMLTAYHQAAFDADMGRHRSLWRFSLAAVYLCCLSVKGSRDTVLLLCCGVWAFTNLTCLTARPAMDLPEDPAEE